MPGDDSKEAQGRRLKLAREHAGYKTAVAGWPVAKRLGKADVSKDTYYQHENGTRSLSAQAQAYADAFGVSAAWLVWGTDPPPWASHAKTEDVRIVPKYLMVRYRVQAGNWHEVDSEEPPREYSGAVTPNPKYAEWPQWLEEVVGDSINKKIQPGKFAHVVDAGEMGYAPKDGDWVVIERRRFQGRERERTIKQIEIREGKVCAVPRSTNPRWSTPITLYGDVTHGGVEPPPGEEVEVEIVGLVIGAYDGDF